MFLLRLLVAGGATKRVPEDAFIYATDGAQRIHPGGFHPAWAGLNIKGRSVKLKTGYRTNRKIMAAATAIRNAGSPVKDGEDDGTVSIENYSIEGASPPYWLQRGTQKELTTIIDEIGHLIKTERFRYEEFGILMRRNEDARSCVDFLRNRGILDFILFRG